MPAVVELIDEIDFGHDLEIELGPGFADSVDFDFADFETNLCPSLLQKRNSKISANSLVDLVLEVYIQMVKINFGGSSSEK